MLRILLAGLFILMISLTVVWLAQRPIRWPVLCAVVAIAIAVFGFTLPYWQTASVQARQALADALPDCPSIAAELRQTEIDTLTAHRVRTLRDRCANAHLRRSAGGNQPD